jgi:hypothetical protein
MRANDPGAFIRELKGLEKNVDGCEKKVVVKICGITSVGDAVHGILGLF